MRRAGSLRHGKLVRQRLLAVRGRLRWTRTTLSRADGAAAWDSARRPRRAPGLTATNHSGKSPRRLLANTSRPLCAQPRELPRGDERGVCRLVAVSSLILTTEVWAEKDAAAVSASGFSG